MAFGLTKMAKSAVFSAAVICFTKTPSPFGAIVSKGKAIILGVDSGVKPLLRKLTKSASDN